MHISILELSGGGSHSRARVVDSHWMFRSLSKDAICVCARGWGWGGGGGHERRLKAKFVQISVGGVNMGGSVTRYSGVMLSC